MNGYTNVTEQAFEELISATKTVTNGIDQVDQQVAATDDAVKSIHEAVDLIASIAGQTNLLSLNASIEAARAGEAGKGFAVVATEISVLADQSRESADKITALIRVLTENSTKSIDIIKQIKNDASRQTECINNTMDTLEKMNEEIGHVSDIATDVSEQTNNLERQKDNLSNVTQNLAAISEENAASTEESSASLQQLADVVEVCNENVQELIRLGDVLSEEIAKFTI